MMIHNCAGKILVQESIVQVDGYVHLVHIFKRRLTRHGTSRNYGNHLYVTQEKKVRLTYDYIQLFCFTARVGVSYVATQFHASNSDGRMSKGVKTSQRCECFIVTSRTVSSKINVKPSKVQIPISFLIF